MNWLATDLLRRVLTCAVLASVLVCADKVLAQATAKSARLPATLGFPEPVLHWLVEEGETCEDVAAALYGSAEYVPLLHRYNRLDCQAGLLKSQLLIVPLERRELPVANLAGSQPEVRARSPQGSWLPAHDGMSFHEGYGVNTLDQASADIRFRDRSRILLQENTLVVIYDSAAASRVGSSAQSAGARVEVTEGELSAGIAALWANPVEVETGEEGSVRVSGREAAIARNGNKTTVSVFDGTADVTSARTLVNVPERHGTSFRDRVPPRRPKPLPEAPSWVGAELAHARWSEDGHSGAFALEWRAVSRADRYRVEVGDSEFRKTYLREEVPSRVHRLRIAGLPPGRYSLRVRAVDDDQLLGLPSPVQTLHVLPIRSLGAVAGQDTLRLSAYGTIEFPRQPDVSVGLGGSQPAATPVQLDELARAESPAVVRILTGDAEFRYSVEQVRPRVELSAVWSAATTPVVRIASRIVGEPWPEGAGQWGGLSAQMWRRADFRLVLRQGERVSELRPNPLEDGQWQAEAHLDSAEAVELAWVDAFGHELARAQLRRRIQTPSPPLRAPLPVLVPLGLEMATGTVSTPLWGAKLPSSATIALETGWQPSTERLKIAASGALAGELGASVSLSHALLGEAANEDVGQGLLMFSRRTGLGTRFGIRSGIWVPMSLTAPSTRIGIGGSFEHALSRGAFWVGADLRAAVGNNTDVPALVSTAHLGATFRWLIFPLVGFGGLEVAHVWTPASAPNSQSGGARGALHVGLEVGQAWLGSVGFRFSPWQDFGGAVSGQAAISRRF